MELEKRLNNFVNYVKKVNPEHKLLDKDLYYQDKLVAKKGYRVFDIEPAMLYRINCLFDDLMVYGDKEKLYKFIEILEEKKK